ncbi:hypothetical protein BC936DRAFT_140779 [Jimgerdemannia flammicorona]|uniref:Uncharacterized protein n=1 Tax=Jimgerdemannia flammicorona TaxID=994334 RepID=A0A433DGQ4_9FUNG|nr:hypothetical protein BC936DRAFT_140779 [Jimgerdemannia flammicorona]
MSSGNKSKETQLPSNINSGGGSVFLAPVTNTMGSGGAVYYGTVHQDVPLRSNGVSTSPPLQQPGQMAQGQPTEPDSNSFE